jgi:hypothetical protein
MMDLDGENRKNLLIVMATVLRSVLQKRFKHLLEAETNERTKMNSDEERRVKALELALDSMSAYSETTNRDDIELVNRAEKFDEFLRTDNVATQVVVSLTGERLVEHFSDRVAHHLQRAETYKSQADALEEDQDAADHQLSNNPVTSLRDSERRHRQRHDWFKFMADNIDQHRTYQLSENDISRLELTN